MLLAAVQSSGARRWGGGVLLAPHRAPSVRTGVLNEGQPAQGLTEPQPLGAKCSVTLALERDTMGNPRFLLTRSPNGRGHSLLLEHSNIRFASCVPF